ncbi:MAG: hypothetical protein R3A11_10015 [Bdellovibrionota bacterium]
MLINKRIAISFVYLIFQFLIFEYSFAEKSEDLSAEIQSHKLFSIAEKFIESGSWERKTWDSKKYTKNSKDDFLARVYYLNEYEGFGSIEGPMCPGFHLSASPKKSGLYQWAYVDILLADQHKKHDLTIVGQTDVFPSIVRKEKKPIVKIEFDEKKMLITVPSIGKEYPKIEFFLNDFVEDGIFGAYEGDFKGENISSRLPYSQKFLQLYDGTKGERAILELIRTVDDRKNECIVGVLLLEESQSMPGNYEYEKKTSVTSHQSENNSSDDVGLSVKGGCRSEHSTSRFFLWMLLVFSILRPGWFRPFTI